MLLSNLGRSASLRTDKIKIAHREFHLSNVYLVGKFERIGRYADLYPGSNMLGITFALTNKTYSIVLGMDMSIRFGLFGSGINALSVLPDGSFIVGNDSNLAILKPDGSIVPFLSFSQNTSFGLPDISGNAFIVKRIDTSGIDTVESVCFGTFNGPNPPTRLDQTTYTCDQPSGNIVSLATDGKYAYILYSSSPSIFLDIYDVETKEAVATKTKVGTGATPGIVEGQIKRDIMTNKLFMATLDLKNKKINLYELRSGTAEKVADIQSVNIIRGGGVNWLSFNYNSINREFNVFAGYFNIYGFSHFAIAGIAKYGESSNASLVGSGDVLISSLAKFGDRHYAIGLLNISPQSSNIPSNSVLLLELS